jgi:hypothetical protein
MAPSFGFGSAGSTPILLSANIGKPLCFPQVRRKLLQRGLDVDLQAISVSGGGMGGWIFIGLHIFDIIAGRNPDPASSLNADSGDFALT